MVKQLVLRKRKEKIPAALRNHVWNMYISQTMSVGKCYCCKLEDISRANFHCGHIIAESKGGKVHIDNLRPLCALCNLSMGKKNMNDFMTEYGFDTLADKDKDSCCAIL